MRYSDLEDALLIGAYEENRNDPELKLTLDVLLEKHPLQAPDKWFQQALRSLAEKNLIYPGNSNRPTRRVSITGEGLRRAEGLLELRQSQQETVVSDLAVGSGRDTAADENSMVESSKWTGVERRLHAEPAVVQAIGFHIQQIDRLVDEAGLTNAEKQRAKAITESLRLLIASPEPEWKAIVALLTSPALTAILNVAQIIQITLALINGGHA